MQLRAVVFVFPCDLNRIINITAMHTHHDADERARERESKGEIESGKREKNPIPSEIKANALAYTHKTHFYTHTHTQLITFRSTIEQCLPAQRHGKQSYQNSFINYAVFTIE